MTEFDFTGRWMGQHDADRVTPHWLAYTGSLLCARAALEVVVNGKHPGPSRLGTRGKGLVMVPSQTIGNACEDGFCSRTM